MHFLNGGKSLLRGFLPALCVVLLSAPTSSAVAADGGSKPLKDAKQRFADNRSTNDRIIQGEDTTIDRNPWQVALVYADDNNSARAQFCGGVIIHPRWVLTAAHCADGGTTADQVDIVSGTATLNAGQGTRLHAKGIIVHPSWNPQTQDFDIALIELATSVQGNPIAPAATANDVEQASKIWVSGWGVTDKRHPKPAETLQGVALDFIPFSTCNGTLSYQGKLTENMFCAGVAGPAGGGGKDSCQGDSGGPASVGPADQAKLVGLVSWGEDCALPYKYGVYTNVWRFVKWVKDSSRGEVNW